MEGTMLLTTREKRRMQRNEPAGSSEFVWII